MSRIKFSDKLSAMVYILLEKGPLSISSLAEEVSKLLGSKTITVRPQISNVLPELIEYGLIMQVGTDRYGSKLIDITPKTVYILILMYASGLEYKFLPWDSLIKYFNRNQKLKYLVRYVELLKCVVDTWKLKVFDHEGEEKAFSDFLEDLAEALFNYKIIEINDKNIHDEIYTLILNKIFECMEEKCDDAIIENVKKLGLIEELKIVAHEVLSRGERGLRRVKSLIKRLETL